MSNSVQNLELEPNVDAYGTYARVSALADFLELVALDGSRLSRGNTADYIGDLSWQSLLKDLFLSDDGETTFSDEYSEEPSGGTEEAAERVFNLLDHRSECLGERYPFHVDIEEGWLQGTEPTPSPYFALLGITIAHAFNIPTELRPTDVFEDTVSRAFADAGHTSLNFSKFRKRYSTFGEALVAAGPSINLHPTPLGAPISKSAQDAGGDVLVQMESGYVPGCDVGAWTLVGQATCGQSDSWQQKLGEVETPAWQGRLGSVLPPQPFLAVPHHADYAHVLVLNQHTIVLDRLRLTRMLTGVSDDELQILDAVMSAPRTRAFGS